MQKPVTLSLVGKWRHLQRTQRVSDDSTSVWSHILTRLLKFRLDDGLKSVPSVGEAVKLIKDVKEMCKRGGFNLHKFVSNNKEVIHSIPTEARA